MNFRWPAWLLSFFLTMGAAAHATDAKDLLRIQLAAGLARGMPSISIAIATRQGVIWSDAVGYANLQSTHASLLQRGPWRASAPRKPAPKPRDCVSVESRVAVSSFRRGVASNE
jgi:hypothetical protein